MHNPDTHSTPTSKADLERMPLLIDSATAASIPGVSRRYVTGLCEAKKVQAIKLGKSWRINRDSWLAYCGLA